MTIYFKTYEFVHIINIKNFKNFKTSNTYNYLSIIEKKYLFFDKFDDMSLKTFLVKF